jgi:PAS domain-containing protein
MSTSADQSPATLKLRAFIDAVLAIAWSALPDGSLDFINQRFRDYTGLPSDQDTELFAGCLFDCQTPVADPTIQTLAESQARGVGV